MILSPTTMEFVWRTCQFFAVIPFFIATLPSNSVAEPDYKIKLEKIAACDDHSAAMADISDLKVRKVNSSSMSIDGKLMLKVDLPDDTTGKVTLYKDSLGRWVQLPINIPSAKACEIIQKDTYIAPTLLKNSDLPKACPFPKRTYKITNAVLVAKKMPAYLPKGCFKADITFSSQKLKKPACFYGIAKIAAKSDNKGTCIH